MPPSPRSVVGYRETLLRCAIALLVGAGATAACVLWVDRPVAEFVHRHDIPRFVVLKWITLVPPAIQMWAPGLLVLLALRRLAGPLRPWERTVLAATVALLIAIQFKNTLKDCFGRTWPIGWVSDVPGLIPEGAYGFHPFHGGMGFASFPSGHTVRVVAIVAALWAAWPRSRIPGVLATLAIAVALIGMDYHFVGDVVAGGVVGGVVGAVTARCVAPGATSGLK
ncbi:MAG TPA: phosphatase PAP2 family protein [Phycisphaerales bacterium]|nr:phosphatase PAP2 family protein [Phycisphaerales bacterium]HMP36343.1 phosphatase PAP2 family protein [Phycisphaerales bacterium]